LASSTKAILVGGPGFEPRGLTFSARPWGPDTTLQLVTVAGHQGYWIAGAPHVLVLIDAAGNPRYETLRLATNTLLIDEGGTIVRIEGDLTKDQALQLAASLA